MPDQQPFDLAGFTKRLTELNEQFSRQLIAQAEEAAKKLYEQSDQLLADMLARKQAAGDQSPPPG